MHIKTRDFGEVQVDEKDIIAFPKGIYGFEDYKEFAMIRENPFDVDGVWLQSTADEYICFILFDPNKILTNYNPIYAQKELEELEISEPQEVELYVIAVIPEDVTKATVNALCPIVIHNKKRLGKQIFLENEEYSMRLALMKE